MASKFNYGGQAVIEGVMIRGRRVMAVAVRRPDGELSILCRPLHNLYTGRWRRLPLARGVIVLAESLVLGMQALLFSANEAVGMEDKQGRQQNIPSAAMWATLAVALAFAIGVFFVVPLVITHQVDPHIGSDIVSNVVEGVIRLGLFLGYLLAIGLWPDIRRVFAYHGAEHMAINAHERGEPLEVEAVRRHITAHPRCGTAFLLTVAVVSIVVFALLGRPDLPLRIASRILLVPVIAAVSYEVIRFNASHLRNAFVRALAMPSLALQSLTTRRPDDRQIEVAIAALKRALQEDEVAAEPEAREGLQV